MRSLIIYDSYFGNTEQIAQIISKSLGSKSQVEICRVVDVQKERLKALDLLIVGSPTRAFRPTKAISDFLKMIPSESLKGIKVMAFDTRISTVDANSRLLNVLVKLFGYAAEPIAKKLVKKGGELVLAPEGFYVSDTKGPLKDGEFERAANWVSQVNI